MIINNKHVQGIFLYTDDIEFEKGDFVVYGDCIYICTAKHPTDKNNNTVSGVKPNEDTEGNYTVYLGDKISSAEEYYEYINNISSNKSIGSDKYISSHTLNYILENMMFGIDSNGIITESATDNNTCTTSLEDYIKNTTGENILDRILKSEKLNNGMIRISRELVRNIIGNSESLPNTTDGKSVILKQYSYVEDTDGFKFRVQEIIDHIKGIVLYRYCKGVLQEDGTWNFEGGIVPWKHSFLNSNFRDDVDSVYNWCSEKIIELETIKRNLVGNFQYRELDIPHENSITIHSSSFDGISNFTESCIITINIQSLYSTDVFKNSSISINLADSLSNNPILTYYVDDNISLILSDISEYKITLTASSGVISDIYYRQKYKIKGK